MLQSRYRHLAIFWGWPWNLAFWDLAYTHVFRLFVGRIGVSGATLAVFLASGVIHDVVNSLPAGVGYGRPMLYFAIQSMGVLFERSRLGKRMGLGRGFVGRMFCALVTLGPVCVLFHRPFVEQVVIPMLAIVAAI